MNQLRLTYVVLGFSLAFYGCPVLEGAGGWGAVAAVAGGWVMAGLVVQWWWPSWRPPLGLASLGLGLGLLVLFPAWGARPAQPTAHWVGTVIEERAEGQRGQAVFRFLPDDSPRPVVIRASQGPAPRWGERIVLDRPRPAPTFGTNPHPWAPAVWSVKAWRTANQPNVYGVWAEVRQSCREVLFAAWDHLPAQAAAFAKALLLGMTNDLTTGEAESFRLAGVSHILALSGLHLTLLGGGLFSFSRPLAGRRWGLAVVSVVLVFYAFLAGPIPSLLRALVMFLVGAGLFFFRRNWDFLEVMALAFLVLVGFDPALALSLSFQLSFASLAGIFLCSRWFQPLTQRLAGRRLGQPLAASLAAVFVSAPLVLSLFGEIRPIGILVGLILEPLTLAFSYAAVLALAGFGLAQWWCPAAIPVLTVAVGWPTEGLSRLTIWVTETAAQVPALPAVGLVAVVVPVGLVSLFKFVYKYRMEVAKTTAKVTYPVGLNYDSPSEIRALLDQLGLNTLKRWGQNFLINGGAREKILAALELQPGEPVWEVGPGLGAMTHTLVERRHPLVVFEIDPGYIDFLSQEFVGAPAGFKVVAGDVVKSWKRERTDLAVWPKVIGNLPYNAASAIIGSFIEGNFFPPALVITVQKEMAQRMTAKVGSKNYSSFSILCQSAFEVVDKGDLKPGSFFPPPEVTSTIIQMKPHTKYPIKDRQVFHTLVREIYSSRRKTLRNNIPGTATALRVDEAALTAAFVGEGIDLGLRAERLTIDQFTALANRLVKDRPTEP